MEYPLGSKNRHCPRKKAKGRRDAENLMPSAADAPLGRMSMPPPAPPVASRAIFVQTARKNPRSQPKRAKPKFCFCAGFSKGAWILGRF
ncbi:MAG: hypothetical protein WC765_08010 [Phycisphaerae bacterium]|jgi:hypothetical protein